MSSASVSKGRALLVALALCAASLLACRAGSERGKAPATLERDALHSQLSLSLTLELGNGQPAKQVAITGRWLEQGVACEHARCLSLRLLDAQVSAPGHADDGAARELAGLARELGTPFLAAYGRDGSLSKVAFAPGTHETVQNLLQLVATQLQYVAGPAQAEHWLAHERDASGEYVVAYHRAPGAAGQVLKQKREYVRASVTQGRASTQGAPSQVRVLESAARHQLDAGGTRVAFAARETLEVSLGPLAFTSSLTLSLQDGKRGAAPALDLDTARYAFRPVQQTELDGEQQLARSDRKLLGSGTLGSLLAELAVRDVNDRERGESLRRRLEALCRLEPASCAELARELTQRKGAEDVLLGALGMVQSEAAHAALLELASAAATPTPVRTAALRYLSRAELSEAHLGRLVALVDDPEPRVRAAVRFACGAVARAVRAEGRDSAQRVTQALLVRLEAARGAEQVELVRALGNAGAPESAGALLALARGADPGLTREALNALRFVELPEVDAQLENAMRKAAEPLTRIAALEATRFRESGALVPAIVEVARKDADAQVRRAALDQLATRLDPMPRLREVLVEATHDRDESVRRTAQRHLDATRQG